MTNKRQFGSASELKLGQGSGLPLRLPCVEIVTPHELWLELARQLKPNLETSAAPSEKAE